MLALSLFIFVATSSRFLEKGLGLVGPEWTWNDNVAKPTYTYTSISEGSCELPITTKTECDTATGKQSQTSKSRRLEGGCRLNKAGKVFFVVEIGRRKRRKGASSSSTYVCKEVVPQGCTRELKECPDGTMVGRDSMNNCEFAPCPEKLKACTRELKECPDGTMVGRDGMNNCEFTPCPEKPKACTRELKECPDGTMVGRDGMNNCEFSPCPDVGKECEDGERDNTHPCTPRECSKDGFWMEIAIDCLFECPEGQVMSEPREGECCGECQDAIQPEFCSRDLHQCPDGSMVGRDAMNECAFVCPCTCGNDDRYSGWNVGDTACEFDNGDDGVNCAPQKACGNPSGTLCTLRVIPEPRSAQMYTTTPEDSATNFAVHSFALIGLVALAYGGIHGFKKITQVQRIFQEGSSYSSVL